MKPNKKVKNATHIEHNGICFKSKLEASCYKLLVSAGYTPNYESFKSILVPSFKPLINVYIPNKNRNIAKDSSFVRSISYSVDFSFTIDRPSGKKYIFIEAKGKPNDVYPIKKKLFIKYLNDIFKGDESSVYFFEVHNVNQIHQCIEIINNLT